LAQRQSETPPQKSNWIGFSLEQSWIVGLQLPSRPLCPNHLAGGIAFLANWDIRATALYLQ